MGPIRSADRSINLEVGVLGIGCIPTDDGSGFENATNAQGHVVHGTSFSAKRERLLVDLIVETGVRLWRVLRGAVIVQEELVEASRSLYVVVRL